MITLHLPFHPTAWTAPQKFGKIHYNPKDKEKKALTKLISTIHKGELINEYVVLEFTFYFTPPASASRKRKEAMLKGDIIPTKSDCTNLQKFAEDCLKKIVIEDDRLVAKISSQKLYAEKECIIIQIQTFKEYRDATQKRDIQENNLIKHSG